jgi:hypothetical protein
VKPAGHWIPIYFPAAWAAAMQTTETVVPFSPSSISFLIASSLFFLASSQSEASLKPAAA